MATRIPRGDGTGAVATGGGTEPMARPAAGHPNASSPTRPDVPPTLRKLAAWSWRLLVVLTAAGLLLGRAVSLHPVVIILALAAGAILGGIVGAFLAVPIAAVVTAVGTYLRGDEPIGEPADQGEPEPETAAAMRCKHDGVSQPLRP